MGQIRTEELANGNIGLEIVYGGADALFGGVDTSAPPAYIDPRCFASCNSALIVNNKLVPFSVQPLTVPTLWNSTVGVLMLGFGTFYNSLWGQLNYAIGYTATPFGVAGTSPTGVTYNFYITSWNPGNPAQFWNDILTIDLYDSYTQAAAASITLPCIPSSAVGAGAGTGATGSITSVNSGGNITAFTLTGGTGFGVNDLVQIVPTGYVPSFYAYAIVTAVGTGGSITTATIYGEQSGVGYTTGSITSGTVEAAAATKLKIVNGASNVTVSTQAYGTLASPAAVVSALISQINSSSVGVGATASIDGQSLIITASAAGTAGNSITVQDLSVAELASNPPPFYFPVATATALQGGKAAASAAAPRTFGQVSTAMEGGTLYIANLGPIILKYSGPGSFVISSMYQGVKVLRKFAGSLIGLGVTPQLGFQTQNQDMIFAWTASGELDIWSPVDGSGNVTGAGFEQLADIGDYLSGLIVSNATAYILRAQGISYATATGNGTIPFSVNHIGLGDEGEGSQLSALVSQYDQTGAFVGNSDVYQISGSISAIGAKIKALLFDTLLNNTYKLLGSTIASLFVGGNQYPLVVFAIGTTLFLFNTSNGTWTTVSLTALASSITYLQVGVLGNANTFADSLIFNQLSPAIVLNTGTGYKFYSIVDAIPNNVTVTNNFEVTFPVEEVSFGRDITIDSLYIALSGTIVDNVTLNFYINRTLYTSLTVTPAELSALGGNPTEYQLNDFASSTIGAGGVTVHAPQLSVQIVNTGDATLNKLRITKLMMLGSFDPNQRPT